MENVKPGFDKNLIVGILLPLIFLATLYTYYRIDLYYSIKYNEEIPNNAVKKGVSDYKLLYSLDDPETLNTNSPVSETLPRGTTVYKGTNLYNQKATHLTVHEECMLMDNKLNSTISFISEDEVEGAYSGYLTVIHSQSNKVFAYDFKNKKVIPVDCNPNYVFSDVRYVTLSELGMSPDGLIDFNFSPKQYPVDEKPGFPYLRDLVRQPAVMWLNPYENNKIMINGELVNPSNLILDTKNNKNYTQLKYDYTLKVIGWVK